MWCMHVCTQVAGLSYDIRNKQKTYIMNYQHLFSMNFSLFYISNLRMKGKSLMIKEYTMA